jgi:bifunctional non-homologous end joining protein LigD
MSRKRTIRKAQHAVAPYAVRAIEGAPIPTPLNWDEIDDSKLDAQRFNIKNIFQRLGRTSDPWKKKVRRSARSLEQRARNWTGSSKKS